MLEDHSSCSREGFSLFAKIIGQICSLVAIQKTKIQRPGSVLTHHPAAEGFVFVFFFQNQNILRGSENNDSPQSPPDPTLRLPPWESHHGNWVSNVAARCYSLCSSTTHCSRPVVTLKASVRDETRVPTSNRFTSSLSPNVSLSLGGSLLRSRPATGQENNHMLIKVPRAPSRGDGAAVDYSRVFIGSADRLESIRRRRKRRKRRRKVKSRERI